MMTPEEEKLQYEAWLVRQEKHKAKAETDKKRRQAARTARRASIREYNRTAKPERQKGHKKSGGGSIRFACPARYINTRRRKVKKRLNKREFLDEAIRRLRATPTGSEVEFGKKLDELGIKHIFQWEFEHKGYCGIADYYLQAYNLVIEVDGGYHTNIDQTEKDVVRDEVLRKHMKHRVLRLENGNAREIDLKELRYLVEFKAA